VASVALAPILLWLFHGATHHGDPVFFLRRVAAYRQALGGEESAVARLLGPPIALVVEAPEIVLLTVLAVARGRSRSFLSRFGIGASALLLFLMLGELAGGAPTHHAARALLLIWCLGAVVVGETAGRLADGGLAPALAFGTPLAVVGAALLFRSPFPSDFVDRSDALELGARARELGAPRLLVDTKDFAHLAVAAAFGRPSQVTPVDDRDPRRARSADPFTSPEALRARLAGEGGAWLVATREHAPTARAFATVRGESGELVLLAPK
jgi:hypothetical protein